MSQGIFITATGTDVGKTFFSALLVKGLRDHGFNAGYYKPVLSGAERLNGRLVPGDAQQVCKTAGLPGDPMDYVAYAFEPAVSPHLAASMEDRRIEETVLLEKYRKLSESFDYLVVEGAGGLLCPLRMEESPLMLPDLIRLLALEILVVAPSGLGSINSTLLTLDYAASHKIRVRGIVLNQFEKGNPMHEDNRRQIEWIGGIPVLSCIGESPTELEFPYHSLF